jgi:vancomycin resistance protein YoaR
MKRFSLTFTVLGLFILGGFEVSAATVPTINLTLKDKTEIVPSTTVETWVTLDTHNTYTRKRTAEIENTRYCPTGYSFCDFVLPRERRHHIKTKLTTTIDEEKVGASLSELALRTEITPKDAVFTGDENGNITLATKEVYGFVIDQEKAKKLIADEIRMSNHSPLVINIPGQSVEPKIKASDIDKLGIKELLGVGTTNFKGSPKNRVYNIKRALEQFQSVMVAPGEEFSFVHYLGEVDGEHGYLPELVIRNNKTEPEFGGGICQVSSTVFRAAIYSGLKITERRNHSYAVQYYKPYGMDATIYVPRPDFKFKNTTDNYIMMQSVIEGDILTFRFFGTKDGRTTTVDGPHILERGGDGSMRTVFTQEVKDKDGNVFQKDSFASNYKSPSLFPHPGEETAKLTTKPANWSNTQWREYKRLNP